MQNTHKNTLLIEVHFGHDNLSNWTPFTRAMDDLFKPRKVSPQNIVIRLFSRQTFGYRKPGTHFHTCRQFYQNIFPNYTIINIEKPPCFLRKFSPDGKHFIAFSADQTSLEVYTYRGPAAAGDMLHQAAEESKDNKQFDIKSKIFERFFKVGL